MVQEGKIAVLVATVTDDVRMFDVPALKVCALRFTETARARILKVRASCLLPSVWRWHRRSVHDVKLHVWCTHCFSLISAVRVPSRRESSPFCLPLTSDVPRSACTTMLEACAALWRDCKHARVGHAVTVSVSAGGRRVHHVR